MKASNFRCKTSLVIAVLTAVVFAGPADAATRSATHHRGGVQSHIVLPSHTLVSGAHERGTLVIGNNTGHPIHWSCGYFDVQLTNAQWPLEIHPTPCSPRGRTLRAGITRLPFTLWASEIVCQGSCTVLPPGTYRTKLFAAPDVVHPGALTVHVVAKAKRG